MMSNEAPTSAPPVFAVPPPCAPPEAPAENDSAMPLLTLSYASATTAEKPNFLYWIRMALIYHGGFYLTDYADSSLIADAIKVAKSAFADVADDEKRKKAVTGGKFEGWRKEDGREVWEFDGTSHNDAIYPAIEGVDVPRVLTKWNAVMEKLIKDLNVYIAEALGISSGFDKFFTTEGSGRVKIARYFKPQSGDLCEQPYMSQWLSLILFTTDVPTVQLRSETGAPVLLPAIPGTLFVHIGSFLDFATHSTVLAVPIRVVPPLPADSTDEADAEDKELITIRYTADVNPNLTFAEILKGVDLGNDEECQMVREARQKRRRRGFDLVKKVVSGLKGFSGLPPSVPDAQQATSDAMRSKTIGEVELERRIRQYPEIGRQFYPDVAGKLLSA
ncbi:hypothetical protein BC832DRAFT_615380 [Gaertneriomyces semiglobifer]|nr:hypothetical protein BC832DRAFT_615380 [Gaertneriomyces semiglobifer]